MYYIDSGNTTLYPSICLYGGFKIEICSEKDPASDVSYEVQEAFQRKKKNGGFKQIYN